MTSGPKLPKCLRTKANTGGMLLPDRTARCVSVKQHSLCQVADRWLFQNWSQLQANIVISSGKCSEGSITLYYSWPQSALTVRCHYALGVDDDDKSVRLIFLNFLNTRDNDANEGLQTTFCCAPVMAPVMTLIGMCLKIMENFTEADRSTRAFYRMRKVLIWSFIVECN